MQIYILFFLASANAIWNYEQVYFCCEWIAIFRPQDQFPRLNSCWVKSSGYCECTVSCRCFVTSPSAVTSYWRAWWNYFLGYFLYYQSWASGCLVSRTCFSVMNGQFPNFFPAQAYSACPQVASWHVHTKQNLRDRYWWPALDKQVKHAVYNYHIVGRQISLPSLHSLHCSLFLGLIGLGKSSVWTSLVLCTMCHKMLGTLFFSLTITPSGVKYVICITSELTSSFCLSFSAEKVFLMQ